jgi:hypothetical protein
VDRLAVGLGDKHLDGYEKCRMYFREMLVGDGEEVRGSRSILVDECEMGRALGYR